MSSTTFSQLNLPDDLLNAIESMGYVTPTEIQAAAIPVLLEGKDVVGVAQTGTGKTAAFGLPLLTHINPKGGVQALVLAPTRELALQSANAISDFAAKSKKVEVVCVYGGSAYGPQLRALENGAQVVVGTPGRIIDLLERGALDLTGVKFFVLDEADEMLRMGFAEDVELIATDIPDDAVRALFSATMPPAIAQVAAEHLHDPVEISVTPQATTVDTVEQTYAVVPYKFKLQALARVLSTRSAEAVIVFVRTRLDAEEVATDAMARGFRTAALSGDVQQRERERIIERLKDGTLDVVVATDVAARGLDVERIGLVVNFDVPREAEAYVHRIGRTGRAGRKGLALTFFTPAEEYRLKNIEKVTNSTMREVTLPSPEEVREYTARSLLTGVSERLDRGDLETYFDVLGEYLDTTGLDGTDVAVALLAMLAKDNGPSQDHMRISPTKGSRSPKIRREETVDENGNFISAVFENGRGGKGSLRREAKRERGSSSRKRAAAERKKKSFARGRTYRIEVGHRDGVRPGSIVGAITNEGGLAGSAVGSIDIYPTFSLVEIDEGLSPEAARKISRATVAGRRLRIKEDQGPRK